MNYKSKSNDSFNSRLRFYLFKVALAGTAVRKEEFLAFDIDVHTHREYVDLYTTEYQQYDVDHKVSKYNNANLNNQKLYAKMDSLKKSNLAETDLWKADYFKLVFTSKLKEQDFKSFEKDENCGYCKTSILTIREMMKSNKIFKKNERGYNLELDRKDPNMEYSTQNCIMACYWCNNAKTDEFNADEFEPIGEAIGKVFKKRENQ